MGVWLVFAAASGSADVDHTVGASVVQIHATPQIGTKVALGSGVVFANGQVATNCHVIRSARSVVVSKGALRFDASGERSDVKRDLCVLEVPSLSIAAAKLGHSKRLRTGDSVYLYGFPRALGLAFSMGQVVSLHPYRGGSVIETTADFTEGSSGGGVFNDLRELVGISSFFSAGKDRHYFAIPAEWIRVVAELPQTQIRPIGGVPFWLDRRRMPGFLRPPGTLR